MSKGRLNELALFAGAGGGILGGQLLGWKTVCAVEIDPFCREVLLRRQLDGCLPKFPVWDDIRTFDGRPWRRFVDVVSGGFPCQDISCAGKGAGINGERSELWAEMARVVREVRPQYVFVENSPTLTTRGLGRVLRDLAEMGFNAMWGVFSGGDVGARHRRERLFCAACRHSILCNKRTWVERERGELENEFINRSAREENIEDHFLEMAKEHLRMDDGVAYSVDAVKAIGNGQIPAVAALAWHILTDL